MCVCVCDNVVLLLYSYSGMMLATVLLVWMSKFSQYSSHLCMYWVVCIDCFQMHTILCVHALHSHMYTHTHNMNRLLQKTIQESHCKMSWPARKQGTHTHTHTHRVNLTYTHPQKHSKSYYLAFYTCPHE